MGLAQVTQQHVPLLGDSRKPILRLRSTTAQLLLVEVRGLARINVCCFDVNENSILEGDTPIFINRGL